MVEGDLLDTVLFPSPPPFVFNLFCIKPRWHLSTSFNDATGSVLAWVNTHSLGTCTACDFHPHGIPWMKPLMKRLPFCGCTDRPEKFVLVKQTGWSPAQRPVAMFCLRRRAPLTVCWLRHFLELCKSNTQKSSPGISFYKVNWGANKRQGYC